MTNIDIKSDTFIKRVGNRLRNKKIGRLFWDKRFVHYTWIGIFISTLNIFLLWLLIDVFGIHTILSSTIVVVLTFILRYILFIFSKIL